MEWMLHHVNVPAHRVKETAAFLRDVVGLPEGRWIYPEKAGNLHHDEDGIAYFGIENRGLHVVRSIPTFARDNGFFHNPTIGGHFALSVNNLDDVKQRLDKAEVFYSDAGIYAMSGIHQIYLYDPSFNMIEVNQIKSQLPERALLDQDPVADVPLHHVAIPAHDLRQSADFFSVLLGLGRFDMVGEDMVCFEQANGAVRLVKPRVTYAHDHDLLINPTLEPSFAMTMPDLGAIRQRLDDARITYSEAPDDPRDRSDRIFTYTPSLRLVALHQTSN